MCVGCPMCQIFIPVNFSIPITAAPLPDGVPMLLPLVQVRPGFQLLDEGFVCSFSLSQSVRSLPCCYKGTSKVDRSDSNLDYNKIIIITIFRTLVPCQLCGFDSAGKQLLSFGWICHLQSCDLEEDHS